MRTRFTIQTCPQTGRRVNLTPESDIPEEVKAQIAAKKKAERNRERSRSLSVWSAVLVWLPFALPLMFFVHGAFTGHPLPILLYPYLVLVFCLSADIGGLLLYIASRKANYFRKPVGFLTLAIFLLPVVSNIIFGDYLLKFDYTRISKLSGVIVFAALLLTFFCMVALCVFSVLMLRKVFPRTSKPEQEPDV